MLPKSVEPEYPGVTICYYVSKIGDITRKLGPSGVISYQSEGAGDVPCSTWGARHIFHSLEPFFQAVAGVVDQPTRERVMTNSVVGAAMIDDRWMR